MTDTKNKPAQTSLFSSFAKQQNNRGNDVSEQAQRLVNLYRHANLFGDNFPETFDKMLLSASPEVLTALNDIIGGPTVRRYYDYLNGKNTVQRTASEGDKTVETNEKESGAGYLPTPDEDLPSTIGNINLPTGQIGGETKGSLETFFKHLIDVHHDEIKKQNTFLQQALDHLQTGLQHQVEEQKKDSIPVKEALAEQQRKQIILLNRTLEKLIRSQTEILVQTLQKFNQNAQDATAKQTNRILEVIQKENKAAHHYSDIIEEGATVSETKEKTNNTNKE